jgi:hypothetical protein
MGRQYYGVPGSLTGRGDMVLPAKLILVAQPLLLSVCGNHQGTASVAEGRFFGLPQAHSWLCAVAKRSVVAGL